MRVLVACEFSGRVRDAFLRLGHQAVSCDLLPSNNLGPHIQDSILNHLTPDWDLLIAFPPCTHLASSGARWFKSKPHLQQEALNFVSLLWSAPIPHIALENPIGILSTHFRRPDQIINPWQFGHPESKSTCLWLKNLPTLRPTRICEPDWLCRCGCIFPFPLGKYGCPSCHSGPARPTWKNQTITNQNKVPQSRNRWKLRSLTYPGIASAMATQWSTYVLNHP